MPLVRRIVEIQLEKEHVYQPSQHISNNLNFCVFFRAAPFISANCTSTNNPNKAVAKQTGIENTMITIWKKNQ
jgi:hypothetical protein